jgi:hypothetical protein
VFEPVFESVLGFGRVFCSPLSSERWERIARNGQLEAARQTTRSLILKSTSTIVK